MKTNHKIHLRHIDFSDKKLFVFLFPEYQIEKRFKKFKVLKGGLTFEISLGFTTELPIYSYTDIVFETELETNLALFEEEVLPIVDIENLYIESAEGAQLKEVKEAERINLENQLQALFPIVLKAFNTFRSACKVALYKESVAGRLLTRNIQDSQIHRGGKPNKLLEDYFSGDDTAFLFDTFAILSLSSFTGEADIQYRISNEENIIYKGEFKQGYKRLHSPSRFFQRLGDIQKLLDDGWTIETETLISSLEFLYRDNYRMAVFTAATILEFMVKDFWARKQEHLNNGSREDQEMVARLRRQIKKSHRGDNLEQLIRIALPHFLDQSLIDSGCLERCIDAWNIRNNRLGHLLIHEKSEETLEVTRDEAWSAVASISKLVDNVKAIML